MTLDRLRNLGFLLAFLLLGVMLFSLYGAFRSAIEGGNWVAFLGGILMGAAMVAVLLIVMLVPERRPTGWVKAITNVNTKYLFGVLVVVWVLAMAFLSSMSPARHRGGRPARSSACSRASSSSWASSGPSSGSDRGAAQAPVDDRAAGQGLAEYALILSLIVIFSILALLLMGDQISTILSTIAGQL